MLELNIDTAHTLGQGAFSSGVGVEHRYIHWDKERSVLVLELNIDTAHTLGQGAFGSGGGVEHRYIHWDKERSVLDEELNIDTYIGTRSVRFWCWS